MDKSKEIERRIGRHVERYPSVDISKLTDEEIKELEQDNENGVQLIFQILDMPEDEALALLYEIEEEDDFIDSLERDARELTPVVNDFQCFWQHHLDTGWFYPDSDDDNKNLW